MGLKRYDRYSASVIRSVRWKGVRLEAKRRDGWQCVKCHTTRGLEVDHIRPVRTHPELAYDMANLQTLCGSCHSRKTRIEIGLDPQHEARAAWRAAIDQLAGKGKR